MPYDPSKPASPDNPPPGGYNPPTEVDMPELGTAERSRMVRRRIAPHVATLVQTMLDIVMAPDAEDKDRIKAAEYLLDRFAGRPAQSVTGEDGKPIQLDAGGDLLERLRKLADK